MFDTPKKYNLKKGWNKIFGVLILFIVVLFYKKIKNTA